MSRISSTLALLASVALLTAAPAHSEVALEAFLGGSFTDEGDLEDSVSGGMRVTAWATPWVGVSGGFSVFAPLTTDRSDIFSVPFTAQVVFRYPFLKDDRFENGRVNPYIGLGGGLFITNTNSDINNAFDETVLDWGADLRGGLDVFITPAVSLFFEYRHTRYEPNVLGEKVDLDTHHGQAGVAAHF